MTTSVWRPIRAELRRILLSISGVPDIAYEMGEGAAPGGYAPTAGVPWIKEALEKGPATTRTLSLRGLTEERGIYQIDLHWPKSGSKADGEDLADKIRLSFWHGREISSSGADWIKGSVLRSGALRTVPGDVWIGFPVRVEFYFLRPTAQGYPGY